MEFAYPARFHKERDGGYLVTFPDLPDAITQGDSLDDAMEMATDCLAETIGAHYCPSRVEGRRISGRDRWLIRCFRNRAAVRFP